MSAHEFDRILSIAAPTLTANAREPWMDDGLCAQTDPEAFFPEKGGSTRDAKRICAKCDVTEQCLAYALEHGERFGIWGGKSERERRKLAPAISGVNPRIAEVKALTAQGLSVSEIAERLGVNPRTVSRLRAAA